MRSPWVAAGRCRVPGILIKPSQIDMAYSITLAHSRGLIKDAQRDEWFTLVSSVGLSMDHELFTEELLSVATEAIK
jgi:3-dehydroquinate synthase